MRVEDVHHPLLRRLITRCIDFVKTPGSDKYKWETGARGACVRRAKGEVVREASADGPARREAKRVARRRNIAWVKVKGKFPIFCSVTKKWVVTFRSNNCKDNHTLKYYYINANCSKVILMTILKIIMFISERYSCYLVFATLHKKPSK